MLARPLAVLPVQATLTDAQLASLKRQALRWRETDTRDHDRIYLPIDHMARAWRERELVALEMWPTLPELAQLLDKLSVALNIALPSSETIAVFFEELQRVPLRLLEAGFTHLLRSYRYPKFPAVADVLVSIDEARGPVLADVLTAHGYCWKVEMFLCDMFPLTVRQREHARWVEWSTRERERLKAVAGPFAPPPPASRASSR